jgi:hypothetical protein
VRIALFTFISLVTVLAGAQVATSSQWKFFGGSPSKAGDLTLFYSESDLTRLPTGILRVWTKGLRHNALEQAYKKMDKGLIDKVAAKIAHYYIPPYAMLKDLSQDELVDVVSSEELANAATIQPSIRILYELNCAERTYRQLSVFLNMEGKTKTSSDVSQWDHIAPETNMASLSTLLCSPK